MNRRKQKNVRKWASVLTALMLLPEAAVFAQTANSTSGAENQPGQNVTVPTGGVYVIDFGNAPVLNTGTFSNSGTVYALSTNPAVTTGKLTTIDFFNNPGALFTSVLPPGGLPGYASAINSLNLVLIASNNFVNSGMISSSGSLNVAAGNSIINALPTNVTATAPVMSAINNLAMQAANIVNSGQILSQLGSINAYTANLNNSMGSMQAMMGNVNVHNILGSSLAVSNLAGNITARDNILMNVLSPVAPSDLSVVGGKLAANTVGFVNPEGHVDVSVNELLGGVGITAKSAMVSAKQSDLRLDVINLSNDPIFTAGGTLDLSGIFTSGPIFYTMGGDFIALAGKNIIAPGAPTGATVNALDFTSGGGQINVSAGVDFLSDGSKWIILGPSSSGGNIVLSNVSFVTRNNSLTMAAYQGALAAGDISVGDLRIAAGGSSPPPSLVTVAADGRVILSNVGNDIGAINVISRYGDITANPLAKIQAFKGNLTMQALNQILLQNNTLDAVEGNLALVSNRIILPSGNKISAFRQNGVGGAIDIQGRDVIITGDGNQFSAVGGNLRFQQDGRQGAVYVSSGNNFLSCFGNVVFDAESINLQNFNEMNAKGGDVLLYSRSGDIWLGSNNLVNAFVSETGTGGNVVVQSAGALNIADRNSVNATGGNLVFKANNNADIGQGNALNAFAGQTGGGSVSIESVNGEVRLRANNDVNAKGGTLQITAPVGVTTMEGNRLSAYSGPGSGDVSITSQGDIGIGASNKISSVGGNISIEASQGTVSSGTGTSIATFNKTAADKGDIEISSKGALNLVQQTIEAEGAIAIKSGASVTAENSIVSAKGGNLSLSSTGGGDISLLHNNRLFSRNNMSLFTSGNIKMGQIGTVSFGGNRLCADQGSIVVHAGGSVSLGLDDRIQSNQGAITVTAEKGNVNLGSQDLLAAGGGDVTLNSEEGDIDYGDHNTVNAFYLLADPQVGGNIRTNAPSGNINLGAHNTLNAVGGNFYFNSATIDYGFDNKLYTFPKTGTGIGGGSIIIVVPTNVVMQNENITVWGDFILTAPSISITDSWITTGGGDIRLTTTDGDLFLLATKDNTTALTAFSTAFLPGFNGDFANVKGGNVVLTSARNIELEGRGVGVRKDPLEPGTNTLLAYGGNIIMHADQSIDLKFDDVLISQKYQLPSGQCAGPGGGIYMTTNNVQTPDPLPLPDHTWNIFWFSDKTKIDPNQPSFSNETNPSSAPIYQESGSMADKTKISVSKGGEVRLNADKSLVHILSSDLTAQSGIIWIRSGGDSHRNYIQIKDSALTARCGPNPPPPPPPTPPDRPDCKPPVTGLVPPTAPTPPTPPACPTPPTPGPVPPGPTPPPPPPPPSSTTMAQAQTSDEAAPAPAIEIPIGQAVTSTDKCTGWFVQDMKESFMQMTDGTKLEVENGERLAMKNGSLLIKAGTETMTVRSAAGEVKMPPSSIALIESSESAPTQIVALDAAGNEGLTVRLSDGERTLYPGDSLIITTPSVQVAQRQGSTADDTFVLHGSIEAASNVYAMKASVHLPEYIPKLVFLHCRNCAFRNYLASRMVQPEHAETALHEESEDLLCKLLPAAAVDSIGAPKGTNIRITDSTRVSEVAKDVYRLDEGAVLFHAPVPTQVVTPHGTAHLKPGCIVLVSTSKELSRVRNLSDSSDKAVQIQVENYLFPLIPGSEAAVASKRKDAMPLVLSDGIARRNFKQVNLGNSQVIVNEFSTIDALMRHPILTQVRYSSDLLARHITSEILKTAAALSIVVDRQKGPYYSPVQAETGVATTKKEAIF